MTGFALDGLSLFGLVALGWTLLCYAMERRARWWTLGFAIGCVAGSGYGFLQGAWPFGLIELAWAAIALGKWWRPVDLGAARA